MGGARLDRGHHPACPSPKIAFDAGRRLQDCLNAAPVVCQCETVSARLHRLSTQGILLAEWCGTESAKQAGVCMPQAYPALSSASDRKLTDPFSLVSSQIGAIRTSHRPWGRADSVRIALRNLYKLNGYVPVLRDQAFVGSGRSAPSQWATDFRPV